MTPLLSIAAVLVLFGVIVFGLHQLHQQHGPRAVEGPRCLICAAPVATDAAGGYRCNTCRFDALRAQQPAFRRHVELLRDLRSARESLTEARRSYAQEQYETARPYLQEASALLRDVERELPRLIAHSAAAVPVPGDALPGTVGAASDATSAAMAVHPILGVLVGSLSAIATGDVLDQDTREPEPHRAGLQRLAGWDDELVKAHRAIAGDLARLMSAA